MEDRRAGTHQRRRHQQHAIGWRHGQQQQPTQRKAHADGQRMWLRMLVCIQADDWLQQRRGDLVRQRQQADLGEAQVEAALEHRIDGQDQRLDHVVEEVREADRVQHAEARAFLAVRHFGGGGGIDGCAHRAGRIGRSSG
ncbi:hypothetical protein D3C81_1715490 [compost metagenome]